VLLGTAHAATIVEDFEGASGSTPPTNWTLETHFSSGGQPTYNTGTGNGGGQGGDVVSFSGGDGLPGGYLLYNDGDAFDATKSISGTFDFAVSWTDARYPAAYFMMGDITSGLTDTATQFVGAALGANTFGNRTYVMDGSGATYGSGIDFRNSGEWHTVTFSWTPTSGTTGDFSFTMTNQRNGGTTVSTGTGLTLGSSDVYFGFGAGQPTAYGPATATFDNISITGTVVPEPSTALLSLIGLGALAFLRRRR
jgi:hypothetical protein